MASIEQIKRDIDETIEEIMGIVIDLDTVNNYSIMQDLSHDLDKIYNTYNIYKRVKNE